ncbi:MAG: hypothetical protein V1644_03795, partial [Candidatus Micrarchaeota archaeon]
MAFILLSALFPNAKYEVKLENPQKQELAKQIAAFSHILMANIYNYSPVSYEKIKALTPKKNGSLKELLSQYTPSKIAELVKPAITLKLEEPTDESQLKKFKEKQKALEDISVCAFLHAIFANYYPQDFSPVGNPQKTEVRMSIERSSMTQSQASGLVLIASNLPEWQIVKTIDVKRQEPKEVFMT